MIQPPVHFSLSHTDGLIACLTSLSPHAAVDVEKVEDSRDLTLVAEQIFSPTELQTLNRLSGADWTARFFDYWTLKEAYAKARGLGLGLKLSAVGFEFGSDDSIRADFASDLSDDSSAWMFWLSRSSPHTISVAAKRDRHHDIQIVRRSVKFNQDPNYSIAFSEYGIDRNALPYTIHS